jgi:preprotein translocase subunit Sec63
MSSRRDYYEVVGVGRSASAEEIRKAHRQPERKYHPGMNTDLHYDLELKFEEGNLKECDSQKAGCRPYRQARPQEIRTRVPRA